MKNGSFGSSFRKQLLEAAFGNNFFGGRLSNFGAQLSGAALQNGFGETFWQTGLQNRSFGAALGRSFEEQLCTAALKNFSSGEHLCERNFGEQLLAATLGTAFGSRFGN